MKFEPGKYYKTRNGSKAIVYAVTEIDGFPLRGALRIFNSDEGQEFWQVSTWTETGGFHTLVESQNDLIAEWEEPKPREILWEWMYKSGGNWFTNSSLKTEELAAKCYFDCVHRKTGRAFYADDGSPVPQDVLDNQNTRR